MEHILEILIFWAVVFAIVDIRFLIENKIIKKHYKPWDDT